MRYAFGLERESIEQVLAAQEEPFELLERITEPAREELNRVTMERR
jgi:hypothetical protein